MADEPILYSTDTGRMCPECGKAVKKCVCKENAAKQVLGDGVVRIGRSTSGRKGKGVSVVSGLPLSAEDLKDLAKDLKRRLGVGGAVKGATIELQTDDREKIKRLLHESGYDSKIAGG